MAVEYSLAEPAIQQAAMELMGKHHPDIGGSLNKGELVVVFREKAPKSGGQVVLGSSKKAAPLINALSGENYVFILEVAKDQYLDLSLKQREALLDHLLCACRAEEDPKTHTWKFSVAKPDVMAYRENVERYGMWFPKGDDENEDGGPDPVGEMFGEGSNAGGDGS